MLIDNQNTAKALFDGRKQYKDCTYPVSVSKPLDMWYSNKNYGFMDLSGNIIYPNEAHFRQLQSDSGIFLAVDFAAIAFNDFISVYNVAIQQGLGTIKDPKQSKLVKIGAKMGWTSPHRDYNLHMSRSFQGFLGQFSKFNRPKGFDNFLTSFREYAIKVLYQIPFTFSGYLASTWVDPKNTGLVIEIASGLHGDDRDKQLFLDDPNFEVYVDVATKHGFVVDKNAPWRLVADINSIAMKPYLTALELTPETAFNDSSLEKGPRYLSADEINMDLLKRYLLGYYNSIMGEVEHAEVVDFSNEKWMQLYVFVRQIEKTSKPKDNSVQLVHDAVALQNRFGSKYASIFVENSIQ